MIKYTVSLLLAAAYCGMVAYAQTSTPLVVPTSAPTTDQICGRLNSSCEQCLSNSACMYCYVDSKCKAYPVGKVVPDASDCADLSNARWGVCWLNFKVLIVVCGVLAIILIIAAAVVCTCCCCCRKKQQSATSRNDDIRMEAQRREAEVRSAERRAEMERKHSEIRKKYGLFQNGQTPYRNLEEEA